jgi:uncharacterized protein YbaA (DUF1428 family)
MKTSKATYVDGFVLVIPKKNVTAYKKMASEAEVIWKKFGALDYKECKGNDVRPKASKGAPTHLSFTTLAGATASDTVWFSYVTYKNKTHRDQVNKKVMAYFSKKYANQKDQSMPFDMAKMAYGGFEVVVG